jgi:hypothetical protein
MWWNNFNQETRREVILFTSLFFLGRYSPDIYIWYKEKRFSDQDDQPFRDGRVDENYNTGKPFSASRPEYMTEEEEKKLL